MLVNKRNMNNIRHVLKGIINDEMEGLKSLEETTKTCGEAVLLSHDKKLSEYIISLMCKEFGRYLPSSLTYREAYAMFVSKKERLERHLESIKSVLNALSEKGLTSVTYSLPILNLGSTCRNLEYAFLMVTGIKKNASEKTLASVVDDDLEDALFAKEIELANYIDDKFRIDDGRIKDFIIAYKEYLDTYVEICEFERVPDGKDIRRVLFEMVLYALFMNNNYTLCDDEEYDEEFSTLNSLIDEEGLSYEDAIERWYRDYKARKDEELKKSIVKGINKKELNILRCYLKKANDVNKEGLGYLKDAVDKLERIHPLLRQLPAPEENVYVVNRDLNTHFKIGVTYQQMLDSIRNEWLLYRDNIRRFQTVMGSLSKDGITNVTYSLPALNITCSGNGLGYSYLMVTGIKKNALEKNPNAALCDRLERKLLKYERLMARFIDEDYCVDEMHVTEFIAAFKLYMSKCLSARGFDVADEEQQLEYAIFQMGLYVLYSNTGIMLYEEAYDAFFRKYKLLLSEGLTEGGALKIIFKLARQLYKDTNLYLKTEKDKAKETEEDFGGAVSEIYDYFENGAVAYPCDLKHFKELLDETNLDEDKKNEFYAQMENLLAREKQEKYEAHKREVLKDILSEEEIGIYGINKLSGENQDTIQIIDDIIEEILMCTSDDEKELLVDMLHDNIGELVISAGAKDVTTNRVYFPTVYYCEEISVDGESVRIPRIFSSLLSIDKKGYKELYSQFIELTARNAEKDREITRKDLPCTIWASNPNGGKYRLFYTAVEDTTVVIDFVRVDEGFDKIFQIVKTEEFKSFLRSLEDYVGTCGTPDAPMFTEMIMNELEKGKRKDKVLNFTQEDVKKTV